MAGLNNDNNPFQTQVRLGIEYIQLVPGPPGPPGQNAVTTTTTANYNQPAVGSTVNVSVTSTAALASGLDVFVDTGGYYAVTNVINSTTVTVQNTGAAGNVSPGTQVSLGSLVVPAGPAGTLTVQSNGGAITQRPILDLEGLQYSDDAVGNRMRFVAESVGAPLSISGNTTLTALQTWIEFTQGPYTITLPAAPVTGRLIELTHISGALEGANQVTLSGNGSSVSDPQTPTTITPTVTLRTSLLTYRYRYNGSIFRCVN